MNYDKLYLGFTYDEPLEKLGGFAILVGMMTLSEQSLSVEYEIRDTMIGVIKSKPKKIEFKFNEIVSCIYEKTWFKSNFKLRTNVFLSSKGFLNSTGNELVFKIKKEDAELAKEFVSAVNFRIADAYIKRMEG